MVGVLTSAVGWLVLWGAWSPAQEAPEGSIEAVCKELQSVPAEALGPVLERAFARYVEEMRQFRARTGVVLASALHERAQATWSAIALASAQRRAGVERGGITVLEQQIAVTPNPADRVALFEALALACDGMDEVGAQLDALGHAYAQGGTDGQQILAGIALREGRFEEAQRLFGGLIERAHAQNREPEPWALPGWGLSILEMMP